MRVIIDASVFEDASANELDLCALIRHGYLERCRVLVWPPYSPSVPDEVHPTAIWLQRLSPRLQEECRMALDFCLETEMRYPSARGIRVTICAESDWSSPEPVLPLPEALAFLQRPFRILLENNRNDRAFLLSVAQEGDRNALETLAKEGWIDFEHAGGLGEMLKRVQSISEDQEETFRAWVLFDSDKLQPGQINPASERVRCACGHRVPFHQLSRRSIENYLPTEVLSIWARGGADVWKVVALNTLNRAQHDYYNMKAGFAGDQERNDGLNAGALYDNITGHVRATLENGFGIKIAELFNAPEFRIAAWYAADGQHAETQPMIKRLLSLI